MIKPLVVDKNDSPPFVGTTPLIIDRERMELEKRRLKQKITETVSVNPPTLTPSKDIQ